VPVLACSCSPQVRTVFVIDPKKVIRLMLSYPASTGRNFDEILRVIDCEALVERVALPVLISR
jgi:alkyl hydroperoxide reductase subunit AhpC